MTNLQSRGVAWSGEARRDRAEQPVTAVAEAEDADETAGRQVQAEGARREVFVCGYLEFHVGQQPGLAAGRAIEVDAEGMAHGGCAPLGADHPSGGDRVRCAVGAAQRLRSCGLA